MLNNRLARIVGPIALLCIVTTPRAEEPTVTPYRPTISNPAQLSAPGFMELEMGGNSTCNRDGSRQHNLPTVLKYAVSEDFGVLLSGDVRLRTIDSEGGVVKGHGDTTLLLKHHWSLGGKEQSDDAPSLGLEWGFKSPTATSGLGSGKSDTIITGIYSANIAENALDINLGVTRLGVVDTGSRNQWSWAAAMSRSISGPWGAAFELAGNARRGTRSTAQAMLAVSYAWSRKIVLDVGFARGLNSASIDRSVFAGIAILLDRNP